MQHVYDKHSRPVDVGDIVYTPFRGSKHKGRVEAIVGNPTSTSTADQREVSPTSNRNYTQFNNSGSTTSVSSLGGRSSISSHRTSHVSGPPTDSFPIITADSEYIAKIVRTYEVKNMSKVVFHDQKGWWKEHVPQAGTSITKDAPREMENEITRPQRQRPAARARHEGYEERGEWMKGVGDTGTFFSTVASGHSPKNGVPSNNQAERVGGDGGYRNEHST